MSFPSIKNSFLDFSPRGYFVEYPLFFNHFLNVFIDAHQTDFKQSKKNGIFTLKKRYSNKAITEMLESEFERFLKTYILEKFSTVTNKIIIVADSGDLRRERFEMVESDIDINIKQLEKVSKTFFNKYFAKKHIVHDCKTIWCKNNNLTADNWKNICEIKIFGRDCYNVIDLSDKEERKVIIEKMFEEIKFTALENKMIVNNAVDWLKQEIASSISRD